MLMALMLQAAAPAADPMAPFDRTAWGAFSRSPALAHTSETVTIATDPAERGAGRAPRFRVRWRQVAADGTATVRWADSGACPAVRELVVRFAGVPLPQPRPPRPMAPDDIVIIADGIGYAVTLPLGYGGGSIDEAATFRSNVGTPLARWVDDSLTLVKRCWPDG